MRKIDWLDWSSVLSRLSLGMFIVVVGGVWLVSMYVYVYVKSDSRCLDERMTSSCARGAVSGLASDKEIVTMLQWCVGHYQPNCSSLISYEEMRQVVRGHVVTLNLK